MLDERRAEYGAQIAAALRRQLGWTHFKALIPLKDALKRDFYAEMCRIEGWSTRVLDEKIEGMLYERIALSKKPEKLIKKELAALRGGNRMTAFSWSSARASHSSSGRSASRWTAMTITSTCSSFIAG